MNTENEINKGLTTGKFLYVAFLAAILIYANILFRILSLELGFPILPAGDPRIALLTIVLSVLAICSIGMSYFLPRFIKSSNNTMVTLTFCIIRAAFFESIAIYGLILGMVGALQEISVIFFVVSAFALVFTFPTKERWKKMTSLIYVHSSLEEDKG